MYLPGESANPSHPDEGWGDWAEPTYPTSSSGGSLGGPPHAEFESGIETSHVEHPVTRTSEPNLPVTVYGDGWEPAPSRTESTEHYQDPPDNKVALPNNISELLDRTTIAEGMVTRDTDIEIIAERPDLLVRINGGMPMEERQATKIVGDRLLNHGVAILPSTLIEHGGTVKAVTKMVDGVVLDQILTPDLPDMVAEQIDKTWTGLTQGLAASMVKGAPYPDDIIASRQIMYGTIAGEDEPKLWMVDLPVDVIDPLEPDEYESELLDLANQVVAIELQTGRELPQARAAIEDALSLNRESDEYGDGLANSTRHVLENREQLNSWEERRILTMRTGYVPPETPELPAFEPYAEQLHDISAQIDGGTDPEQIPGYVGTTNVGQVVLGQRKYAINTYDYETADGSVLRVPRADLTDIDGRSIERRHLTAGELAENIVEPLLAAFGAEHLQQVITYTGVDGGGAICERPSGAQLEELLPREINRIPQNHFEGLMRTCQELSERGLQVDYESLVYDRTVGFTVTNYRLRWEIAPLPADHYAADYGLTIAWQAQRRDTSHPSPLPPVGETIYRSLRATFGDVAAQGLLERWSGAGTAVPEHLLAE